MPKTKPKPKSSIVYSHLAPPRTRRVRGIESRFNDVFLRSEEFSATISDPLSCDLSRTIEGASTVTVSVHDPNMFLLRSEVFDTRCDLRLDGLHFRLVSIEKQEAGVLVFTFEDREVALMRQVRGARQMSRDKVTRAEFVFSEVREVRDLPNGYKIPVYIPDLRKERPIGTSDEEVSIQTSIDTGDAKGGQGLDASGGGLDSSGLTVKGVKANPEQLQNGETVLRVGASMGADARVLASAIVSGIQENNMTNADAGSGCRGYFCIIDSTAAGLGFSPLDLVKAAESYYGDGFGGASGGAIQWAKDHPSDSPAEISSGVEVNAAGASDRYQWENEAADWVAAFSGGGLAGIDSSMSGTTSFSVEKEYAFRRAENENAWDNTGKLADEVQFRRFMSAGVFYYVAETKLIQGKPLMYVGADTQGIDDVTFTWDLGQRVQEVTIVGRAKDWAAPPGCVVKLLPDFGEAVHGRYVVSTIDASLLDETGAFTATLKKPMAPLPEPPAETVTKTQSFGESGSFTDGLSDIVGGGGGTIDTSPGDPHWGGGADIMHQFVDKVAAQHGIQPGARKEEGHAEGGDHDPSITNAYATDYPTMNGTAFANAVCDLFGVESTIGTFDKPTFEAFGETFGCQVLWQVEDHYDHVHVGIRHGGY